MKKNLFIFLGLILLTNLFSFILIPATVQADVAQDINEKLQPIEDVYGREDVTESTLAESVALIIKTALSVLALIFIILIIYAGFTWMTSGGNEEKITKAKKILSTAIIGVAIVLAAYAITVFVIDSILDVTVGEEN